MTTTTNYRRAWSATVTDGHLRDHFANSVANRIHNENQDSAVQGYPAELVEDFLERCDAIFAEHCPATVEAVEVLTAEIDTADLYDLTGED